MYKVLRICLINLSAVLRRLVCGINDLLKITRKDKKVIQVELPHLSHNTEIQNRRFEQQETRSRRQKAELEEATARIKTLRARLDVITRR